MRAYYILFASLFVSLTTFTQHLYQQPKPLKKQTDLNKIIDLYRRKSHQKSSMCFGSMAMTRIVFRGTHYVKVKDLMTGLLKKVPNLSVEEVFHFPAKSKFDSTHLIVMYLHLPPLDDEQFANFQRYIKNGGGVVALHETAIIRPATEGKNLSECLGCAWNEGVSKWEAIFDDINNEHIIFKGFPKKLKIIDAFYWDLYHEDSVKVLGMVRNGQEVDSEAPLPIETLSEEESPVFWKYESGKGTIFGTTTGHHTFTYFDPEFRMILFRAMAWAVDEKADPFMPLVLMELLMNKGGYNR